MIEIPELPPPTARFADFTDAEQLVLTSLRRWLAGPPQREVLWRALSYELDPANARSALKGLEATIRAITVHAHRNIAYHQPCCPCVGRDEAGFLTLVSAVQRRQEELARVVARSFVRDKGIATVLAAVGVYSTALVRAKIELPLRFVHCDDGPADDVSPQPVHTLH